MISWFVEGKAPGYRHTFGAKRPSKKSKPAKRHHNGVDIMDVGGMAALAPEPSRVVRQHGWTKGTRAIVLETPTGVWVLGGLNPDTIAVEPGDELDGGDHLGVIAGGYDELHIERWDNGTTRSVQWCWGEDPPDGLREPYAALDAIAGGVAPGGLADEPPGEPPDPAADEGYEDEVEAENEDEDGPGTLGLLVGASAVLSIAASVVALSAWQSKSK